jgi:diguanylate cyclase (GGDEF)-like protein
MEQEVARSRRTGHGIALLLMDVDHFKKVNDTYGHPVGDAVLRSVADVARQHTRKSDVVARVGGDEFALLLGSNTLAGATTCAEGLRRRLRVANLELPRDLSVTVSIGIAVYPSLWVSSPLDDLVRVSDEALLRAKALGRDRIVLAGEASAAGRG